MDIESLVLAAKKGDDHSFYQLMESNKIKLYKMAYSYLRNEIDSLEAIQETTFRAYKKLRSLKDPKYFNTWIVRILINYCMDELKRRKRTIVKDVETAVNSNMNMNKIEIEQALDYLQTKYQTVIILKYFQDLTIHDIADLLKRPEGTIKTWLNKALKELRKYLGEDGESLYV